MSGMRFVAMGLAALLASMIGRVQAAIENPWGTAQRIEAARPNPGPQQLLVKCPIGDVFFCGERGSGKTKGIILDWFFHATQYGSDARGLLIRRTYTEFHDIERKCFEILEPAGWTYVATEKRWTSPAGAVLYLAYFRRADDYLTYHGHEYTWIGIDELPNFDSPTGPDYLRSLLRSSAGVPCYFRGTGNAGGVGHSWVKGRYRLGSAPGSVPPLHPFKRYPIESRPDLWIESVTIAGRLADTPQLDAREYLPQIAAAAAGNERLFRAWSENDWDIVAGQYFASWDLGVHRYDPMVERLDPHWPRWIACDWGRVHAAAVYWLAYGRGTIWVYRELVRKGLTPADLGELVLKMSLDEEGAAEEYDAFYLSHDAFAERESPRTIARQIGEVLEGQRAVPAPRPATKNPRDRWNEINARLSHRAADGTPAPTLRISAECPSLLSKIPVAQHDPHDLEVIQGFAGDDELDALGYGVVTWLREGRVPAEDRVAMAVQPLLDAGNYQTAYFRRLAEEAKVRRERRDAARPWRRR